MQLNQFGGNGALQEELIDCLPANPSRFQVDHVDEVSSMAKATIINQLLVDIDKER